MKITSIRAHPLEAPIDQPFAVSQGWVTKRVDLVVEIETDAGFTGYNLRDPSSHYKPNET